MKLTPVRHYKESLVVLLQWKTRQIKGSGLFLAEDSFVVAKKEKEIIDFGRYTF